MSDVVRDRFGNAHAAELPYARGKVVTSTEDDIAKLDEARRLIRERHEAGRPIYNFSGLERGMGSTAADDVLDDELAPALYGQRFERAALEHLGGVASHHDVHICNRLTAAIYVAEMEILSPGDTVVGISASHSHPALTRAARLHGASFVDTSDLDAFETALTEHAPVRLVALTRLAVTYELLPLEVIERAVGLAHDHGARVVLDDAGGARVGPAVFGQPRALELGVDVAVTGLDKYGTQGPRLGLLGGRRGLVAGIRARSFELGVEARPMLYPAVVRSLEEYEPERVRELVGCTKIVGEALKARLGDLVVETPVIVTVRGEDLLARVMAEAGLDEPPVAPAEATAALAMLLLREHGVITVHFAGLPPGTSALLIKFVPPHTLDRFGGTAAFADAIAGCVGALGDILSDSDRLVELLYGRSR